MVGLSISNSIDITGRRFSAEEAETAFVIEVDTTIQGTGTVSATNQMQLTGAQGTYEVEAYQNDALVSNLGTFTNQQTLTLPSGGVYDLRIIPTGATPFNRINFNSSGDRDKLLGIKNWGTEVVWSNFTSAFFGCNNNSYLPNEPIYNAENLVSFFISFRNNNLTSIPKGLFDNCGNATLFQDCFRDNILTTLPQGLFNNCVNVNNFVNCFRGSILEVESLSRLYIELSLTNTQNNVEFHGGSGQYDPLFAEQNTTTGVERANLVTRGWTLTDGGAI